MSSSQAKISYKEIQETLNTIVRLGKAAMALAGTHIEIAHRHARIHGEINGILILFADNSRVIRMCDEAHKQLGPLGSYLHQLDQLLNCSGSLPSSSHRTGTVRGLHS
jgi:hypothetical protein